MKGRGSWPARVAGPAIDWVIEHEMDRLGVLLAHRACLQPGMALILLMALNTANQFKSRCWREQI